MDIFYTIEEKYLQAVEELSYGEAPKSLQLLNNIIQTEPPYARAHYQLGLIYFYNMNDYQSAGYHLKLCIELEPTFPDAYVPYLKLLVFLQKENLMGTISKKALEIPGVQHADVYQLLGIAAEKNHYWQLAAAMFKKALLAADYKKQVEVIEEDLERIELKVRSTRAYTYSIAE